MNKSGLFFLSITFLLSNLSFTSNNTLSLNNISSIVWTKTEYDFGKIQQNTPVTAEFEFKNPSLMPLVISSVEPQCGCTVADYPKEPVKSGKTGKIMITYDAKNMGFFQKSIVVTSNTEEGTTNLIIKGEVIEKIKTGDSK